jgi:hypothetical protein
MWMAAGHFCHVDSRDLYNFVGTDSAVYKSLKHQDRYKKTSVLVFQCLKCLEEICHQTQPSSLLR